jgi:lactate racemase
MEAKTVRISYGKSGLEFKLPSSTTVLKGQNSTALTNPTEAVLQALAHPIGSPSLTDLVKLKKPKTIAITISDITRPVPNRKFLPPILKILNECGISDSQIVIIIGTGMHRRSSREELEILAGLDILKRIEVIDHTAGDDKSLVKVSGDPPVSICRRFVEADFRIVTGYIEPHFMAGFSGGRKGACPALADLKTIQRFHGYKTLSSLYADNGILTGNPCHEIALTIARKVGVDFLFNVAITREREIAGIYCGDLEQAHLVGCMDVAKWTCVEIEKPFDLVITSGGGYPLDQNFYQTVKGMCGALPALDKDSTLLVISHCGEQIGSKAYTDLMLSYNNDWRRFLRDISHNQNETHLDQWEFQMHTRVLNLIGLKKLWFASDGIPYDLQQKIAVTPILGSGNIQTRVQKAIDDYVNNHKNCRVAVIPEGPYTMLHRK